LHTDIAVLVAVTGLRPVGGVDDTLRVADGEVLGVEGNSRHWIYARFLLEAVSADAAPPPSADPSKDDGVRLWYRAASAWLAHEHRWSEAAAALARGCVLFPGDARLLFYSGAMHEVFATPEVQGAAQSAVRAGIGLGVVVDRKELALAE